VRTAFYLPLFHSRSDSPRTSTWRVPSLLFLQKNLHKRCLRTDRFLLPAPSEPIYQFPVPLCFLPQKDCTPFPGPVCRGVFCEGPLFFTLLSSHSLVSFVPFSPVPETLPGSLWLSIRQAFRSFLVPYFSRAPSSGAFRSFANTARQPCSRETLRLNPLFGRSAWSKLGSEVSTKTGSSMAGPERTNRRLSILRRPRFHP